MEISKESKEERKADPFFSFPFRNNVPVVVESSPMPSGHD